MRGRKGKEYRVVVVVLVVVRGKGVSRGIGGSEKDII